MDQKRESMCLYALPIGKKKKKTSWVVGRVYVVICHLEAD